MPLRTRAARSKPSARPAVGPWAPDLTAAGGWSGCVLAAAVLMLAVVVWFPRQASCQDSATAQRGAAIIGTVRTSGLPLAGVTVEILGVTNLRTDTLGTFRVKGLSAGTYILRVRKVGFTPSMKAVTVREGTELTVPIELDPVAQQLARVVTNADSARLALADPSGFAWRRRMEIGRAHV